MHANLCEELLLNLRRCELDHIVFVLIIVQIRDPCVLHRWERSGLVHLDDSSHISVPGAECLGKGIVHQLRREINAKRVPLLDMQGTPRGLVVGQQHEDWGIGFPATIW